MKDYLSKLLENGLILAFLTGVAYYLTYLRLDGSLAAYALPDEFIEIDAPDIIATLIDLIYKFWRVLLIPAFGLVLCKMFKDPDIIRLWRFSIVMASSVFFSVSLLNRFEANNWILIAILGYEWLEELAKSLLHGKSMHGLRAKWKDYHQKLAASREINSRVASGIGYLAVIIAIMFVISGALMERAATEQLSREDFYIARDYNDQVVIFQNGTRYVLMAREGSALQPDYQIVRYDHIGKLDYVHTGVLTLPGDYPSVEY